MTDDCKCKGFIGNLPPSAGGGGAFAPDPHVVDSTVHSTAETDTSKVLAPNGTGGVAWVAGGGASLGDTWIFKTDIGDSDPGSKNFKFDNATQTSATWIYVSNTTDTGVDFSTILLGLKIDDNIYIQENLDSTHYHMCKVTGDPVDGTTYVKIPITVVDSGLDLTNNKKCGWVLLFTGGAAEAAYSPGYLIGANIEYTATDQITIQVGACRDDVNTENIVLLSPQVVDIDDSGANGLDTGTKAADTWYYVWLIKDVGTPSVAGLLSLSSTSPTMPGSYTKKRRIGQIRTDGSSNIELFRQFGSGPEKQYMWDNAFTATRVLNAGSATSFTDIDLSDWVPPISQLAYIQIMREAYYTGPNTVGYRFRPNGSTEATPQISYFDTFSSYKHRTGNFVWIPTDSNQLIEYYTFESADEITVWVYGYQEDL